MSCYRLQYLVETCLGRRDDLAFQFKQHTVTFLFSKKASADKYVSACVEVYANNNRDAQLVAASIILPPLLDALSFSSNTPLLLGACTLVLKNEAPNATRKAIYVGQAKEPQSVEVTPEMSQEVQRVLQFDDAPRVPLCWNRYAIHRQFALDSFVFQWLAFEQLSGDADIETRCPQCGTGVIHCDKPIVHRTSNKAKAWEIFARANPDASQKDFKKRIWGKVRNSVFHGGHYPDPAHLSELSAITKTIRRATENEIAREFKLETQERAPRHYEQLYLTYLFLEWETKNRSAKFADDLPVADLVKATSKVEDHAALHALVNSGLKLLDYNNDSSEW